jgi:hypothetical protein
MSAGGHQHAGAAEGSAHAEAEHRAHKK